jgi:hypothetical protein
MHVVPSATRLDTHPVQVLIHLFTPFTNPRRSAVWSGLIISYLLKKYVRCRLFRVLNVRFIMALLQFQSLVYINASVKKGSESTGKTK